jgi:glycosyltransferase involved in cell wall biosynthesis
MTAAELDYDVVIPTHGRDLALLGDAVDSVRRQTVPPRSIIVVVDGNAVAAEALRRSRPFLDVVLQEPAAGAGNARQAGIERTRAGWVAFLDDDDLWAATKQATIARYLAEHPECAAVRTAFWTFTTSDSAVGSVNEYRAELVGDSVVELEDAAQTSTPLNDMDYLDIEGQSLALMLERNRGVIGSTVVRGTLVRGLPRVPHYPRPGDDHLLLTLVAARTEWHLIRERLLFYRLHPGQDTRSPDPAAARSIIRSRRTAWQMVGTESSRPLRDYGPAYRREFRRLVWPLLRGGALGEYARACREAWGLLPRRGDRLLLLVPEPVVWRLTPHRRRPRGPRTRS